MLVSFLLVANLFKDRLFAGCFLNKNNSFVLSCCLIQFSFLPLLLGPGTIDPQPPKSYVLSIFKSVLLYEPFFVLDKWVLGSDLIYITIILYIIFTKCLHAYVITSAERITVSIGRYRGLSRSLCRVL